MLGSSSANAAALVGQVASSISKKIVILEPSPFSSAFSDSAQANIVKLQSGSSDPADVLVRLDRDLSTSSNTGLISLLASADASTLSHFLTSSIHGLPVVLHIATIDSDHAPLELLKSSGYPVIYSGSKEEAQKNVLLASKIALSSSRALVHFFEPTSTEGEDLSVKLIQLAPAYFNEGPKLNGHSNGDTNGHSNGHANGQHTQEDHDRLPSQHHSLQSAIDEAFTLATSHHLGLAPSHYIGANNPSKLILGVGTSSSFSALVSAISTQTDTAFLSLSLLRPRSPAALLSLIPQSVSSILVIDQAYTKTTKWSPLYLEVLAAFHASQADESPRSTPQISSATLGLVGTATASDAAQVAQKLLSSPSSSSSSSSSPILGELPSRITDEAASTLAIPKHELAYHKVLSQSFPDRLNLLNSLESPSPALAVGKFLATPRTPDQANWIIGSDAWSYDTGLAGLQTLLSTGLDCNILVVDTSPYPAPPTQQRKKDVGLYALNYGNAYVASVAIYGDYSQAVRAILEAEKFKGPSVVMAYLPGGEDDNQMALEVLKNTKKAMESGYWGLYRFDPSKPEKEAFSLDSVKIKKDVQEFLDRQNLLTQLANRLPSYDIPSSSLGKQAKQAAQSKAQEAYARLSGALASGPSLLVLYASDGGTAEKLAKKFIGRATARGVNARLEVMDTFGGANFDSLKDQKEDNIVFITSTAGQGEFPLNGRGLWKAVSAARPSADNSPDGGEGGWAELKYSVFGLGDSHYWPRPEDAGYYNKPAKDLDKKLSHELAIPRLVEEIGLGDDQDADGYMTGYKVWEQQIWKALGVAGVDIVESEQEPITNEHIKIASNYLRGTIKEGLVDTSTGALAESDGQLTKFHGIYQQFDRDIQEERAAQGLEPAYSFMVRVRMPAGVCSPDQWLAVDQISDDRGNGTFKLTTRQTFQFHGIIKANLKPAIQEINKAMLDTIAACGDVNRNVMCSCNPSLGPIHAQIAEIAKNISEHLMPRTNAYAEIWLDKKMIAGDAVKDVEPLYGKYYLPRKFKIAIAVPPNNDTDCFCHDIGLIAIVKNDKLLGFNVSIGGGMGVTHSMKKTYPRLGTVIGFVTVDQVVDVCEKIMLVQRDNGDRTNRKHARMKYTVDDMTPAGFKAATEELLKYKFEAEKPYKFERNIDTFGWQTGYDGKKHFTCFIENGRVQDEPGKDFRTGLREIAKVLKEEGGVFRLTANQHVIISDIVPGKGEEKVAGLLKKYGLDNVDFSALRLSSSACVAFPTCGLAMAESERYLPVLIDKLEKIIEENGLRNDSIVMRMTGCPNGCARPWVAESAFVGKAPNSYLWMLGGAWDGTRLSKPYREAVGEEEILAEMSVLIKRYANERLDGERFGDFVIRVGIVKATLEGKHFYDDSCIA